jgi:pimeloyl-ACP methyl ester carboxylesterase
MTEIELSAGTIAYEDTGGDGPTVVLLHGLMMDSSLWDGPIADLSADHRCLAPTLPLGAHRHPMHPDADLSLPALARLVAEFLDRLDLHDVTLVGNDTGGVISQLVALDHGERLGRLVLTNCDCFEVFPPPAFKPMVQAARIPGALYAALQPLRTAAGRRLPMAYGKLAREIPDEVTSAWVAPFLEDAGVRRETVRFVRSMDNAITLDAAARFPSLRIPSLVAWGQDDAFFTPELGQRLAAALPNARLEPIAGARTFVSEDAPDALADLIRGFVREGSPRPAAA